MPVHRCGCGKKLSRRRSSRGSRVHQLQTNQFSPRGEHLSPGLIRLKSVTRLPLSCFRVASWLLIERHRIIATRNPRAALESRSSFVFESQNAMETSWLKMFLTISYFESLRRQHLVYTKLHSTLYEMFDDVSGIGWNWKLLYLVSGRSIEFSCLSAGFELGPSTATIQRKTRRRSCRFHNSENFPTSMRDFRNSEALERPVELDVFAGFVTTKTSCLTSRHRKPSNVLMFGFQFGSRSFEDFELPCEVSEILIFLKFPAPGRTLKVFRLL